MEITAMAETIRVGDVILPPERELRLWMRRAARERGLTDSALHLTVKLIRDGGTDKGGRWLVFTTSQTDEWSAGRPYPFTFKARPGTKWAIIARADSLVAPASEPPRYAIQRADGLFWDDFTTGWYEYAADVAWNQARLSTALQRAKRLEPTARIVTVP